MINTTSNFFRSSPLMQLMTNAAFKASKRLIRDFGEVEKLEVSRKSVKDFVSTADLTSERTIVEELKTARPNFSFLTEEKGYVEGKNKNACFIIDPLDGTINFLRGLSSWCISIALEEKGVITAGVVLDPLKNEIFTSERGYGAFRNGQRIRASKIRNLSDSLIVSSRLEPNKLAAISEQCIGLRKIGSIALSLCYTAAGIFDAFISNEKLMPWDTAAGLLIAEEAGCVIKKEKDLTVSNIEIATPIEKLIKKL